MIFFINFLKALAACLITNAHYEGVYPVDIIANGGLIGDILFFCCSGYCLYNVKLNFFKWYPKRLYRIYVPVILITVIYLLIGLYNFEDRNMFEWLIYPTNYHFIASLVILYIPYYFCLKIDWLRNHLIHIMCAVFVLWILIYFIAYDKSYYHIDDVHEHMIKFLFFESMLLGAVFRKYDKKIRNNFKKIYPIVTAIVFILYFSSKLFFSRYSSFSNLQFINQIIIFVLLIFIMLTFDGLDSKLEKLPLWIKNIIQFISNITLEIYIVQYAIISFINSFNTKFPVNWILLTAAILISAALLHYLSKGIYSLNDLIIKKIKNTSENSV
ncbi:MAG: acyltransferase family protein [Eubacterium sp.]